ncbi:MAG TPA: thioredoxin family protein [Methylophilaceae bacterium]|jgi:peroxiredoxin|nr:thioredoxin family protein [Methylophilaceae bacterium]HCC72768.1 thioredoxin family protein [Methylophilaceae bacterium]
MVSLNTPLCDFGWKAIDFNLEGVDGAFWTLEKSKGVNGLLVMFICNHCPYVKAILPRLIRDICALKDYGIKTIAIQSNDPSNYPEDSFENMRHIADQFHFSFPYVIDKTQETARAYNAICTPDFFGFNRNLELQYRGRFDATGRGEPPPDNSRDLYEAMKLIAETQKGPVEQKSSIGCSIKWRE